MSLRKLLSNIKDPFCGKVKNTDLNETAEAESRMPLCCGV